MGEIKDYGYAVLFAACLCLAETIDLFMGKDFLMFMGSKMDEKDYDLPKVYCVEKWLFAADTIGCFILTKGSWIGVWGQIAVIFLLFITVIMHTWVFNDDRFMSDSGKLKKLQRKEARKAWKNRKKE